MSHAKADKLLIRPTHGDRAGAGDARGHVPAKSTFRAGQYLSHTGTTGPLACDC